MRSHAIGHQALDSALRSTLGVFLHTASGTSLNGTDPEMPDRLKAIIDRPKQAVNIDATYAALKDYLLS